MGPRGAALVLILAAGLAVADQLWADGAARLWVIRALWRLTDWMAFWR